MLNNNDILSSSYSVEERGWKEENKENTRVGEAIADPG